MGTLWRLVAMAPLFILDAVVHIGHAYRPCGGACGLWLLRLVGHSRLHCYIQTLCSKTKEAEGRWVALNHRQES